MSDESFLLYLPEELPELTKEEAEASNDEFTRQLLEICSKPITNHRRSYCTICDDCGHAAQDHE